MKSIKYFPLYFFVFFFSFVQSQEKFEKEERISPNQVPQKSINYIQGYLFQKRVKWYKEIGLTTTTFEAKTKYNKNKISIEFNEQGALEDVEVAIIISKLQKEVKQNIQQDLIKQLKKYSIKKIQIQYSGNADAIRQFVLKNTYSNEITIRYEVEVVAKELPNFPLYEFLFDEKGNFINQRKIILRNTDNLEY